MFLDYLQIIYIIKDIMLGCAAKITYTVAIIGINSWKKQLKGRTYFKISRDLLLNTYKLRDAIQISRSRFTFAYEFPENYNFKDKHTNEEEGEVWSHIYFNRMKPIYSQLREYDIISLEAETFWGNEIKSKTFRLKKCVTKLRNAIDIIIDEKINPGENFDKDHQLRKETNDIIYNSDNDFTHEILNSVEDIEAYCKKFFK